MTVQGLGALLERAAGFDTGIRFLDRREREVRLTYREILERAGSFAAGLEARGIVAGDRVALILPTGPEFFDSFFGCILMGAIPVPLYPPVRLGRLAEYHQRTAHMLRACAARLVVADSRTRRVLGATIEAVGHPLDCVLTGAIPVAGTRRAPLVPDPDGLAFIQFSSGTTVAPKPVQLSHAQVLANARAIHDEILNAHPETPENPHVCVSWLPLYHDMGLVGGVMTAMSHPVELVLIPPELFVARPIVWLRALSRYRGTISVAPNFAYSLCADRVRERDLDDLDLSAWSTALNGAEPVAPRALERFISRFARCGLSPEALTPVYGLAEATLAVTFSDLRRRFRWRCFDRELLVYDGLARPAESGLELVSLGPALPGIELRIVSDDGTDIEDGRTGRVWVRGPSVMLGYDAAPEATAAALRDGWLETGDLGFLFKGELYLYGRAKDVIIIRGKNHSPQDIEDRLDGIRGLRKGCVAAVGAGPDEGTSETLWIFVERSRTNEIGDEAIARAVSRRSVEATGLLPTQVIVLEPGTLPRTSSGKIRRAEALRQYRAGQLEAPRKPTALRMAREMLRSAMLFARRRRASRGG